MRCMPTGRVVVGRWGSLYLSFFMVKVWLTAGLCFMALQAAGEDLTLHSKRVLVFDSDTGESLYAKAADTPAPIASVTKLMTAMVMLDEKPDLEELLTVTADDVDTLKNSHSRLAVGTSLTRRDMLHLALMSSENRAAHVLARTSRQGLPEFVASMNRKAQVFGMQHTQFVDPTGLSPGNWSTAADLALLARQAARYGPIGEFTTTPSDSVLVRGSRLQYRNSNPVVGRQGWDVWLSKTGFINEAGSCMVVGFRAGGRNLAVVLLGAGSKAARQQDLVRVRDWATGVRTIVPAGARARGAHVRGTAGVRHGMHGAYLKKIRDRGPPRGPKKEMRHRTAL